MNNSAEMWKFSSFRTQLWDIDTQLFLRTGTFTVTLTLEDNPNFTHHLPAHDYTPPPHTHTHITSRHIIYHTHTHASHPSSWLYTTHTHAHTHTHTHTHTHARTHKRQPLGSHRPNKSLTNQALPIYFPPPARSQLHYGRMGVTKKKRKRQYISFQQINWLIRVVNNCQFSGASCMPLKKKKEKKKRYSIA